MAYNIAYMSLGWVVFSMALVALIVLTDRS